MVKMCLAGRDCELRWKIYMGNLSIPYFLSLGTSTHNQDRWDDVSERTRGEGRSCNISAGCGRNADASGRRVKLRRCSVKALTGTVPMHPPRQPCPSSLGAYHPRFLLVLVIPLTPCVFIPYIMCLPCFFHACSSPAPSPPLPGCGFPDWTYS